MTSLADLARLTDVFSSSGTKCGTLFGEVVRSPSAWVDPANCHPYEAARCVHGEGASLGVQFERFSKMVSPDDRQARRRRPPVFVRPSSAGYVTMESPTNLTFVALDQAGHGRSF